MRINPDELTQKLREKDQQILEMSQLLDNQGGQDQDEEIRVRDQLIDDLNQKIESYRQDEERDLNQLEMLEDQHRLEIQKLQQ